MLARASRATSSRTTSRSSRPSSSRSSRRRSAPCRRFRSASRRSTGCRAVDFFARQEATRRTSRVLVGLFLLSFAVVAAATTAAVTAALRFYAYGNELHSRTATWQDWVLGHFGLVTTIALGTFALMACASFLRASSLAGGGGQVARMLGATQITGGGADPLQRRLLNVVEEMAIASGVPVPEVYVLEQEAGINAFAAGT